MIDPVTGLYNRRGFNFHTAQQIKTHKGSVGPGSTISITSVASTSSTTAPGIQCCRVRAAACEAAEGRIGRIGDDEFALFVQGFASEGSASRSRAAS